MPNRIISLKPQYLKPFNCMQINEVWLVKKLYLQNIAKQIIYIYIYIYTYIYMYVCVYVCVCVYV